MSKGVDIGTALALIQYLSKNNAMQYGNLQITGVGTNPAQNALRFNFVGGYYYDVPLTSIAFMLKTDYDPDNNKKISLAENSELLDGKLPSYYLDRSNHTSTQNATTISIDKTNFTEFFKDFTGTTLQQLADYMDTHKEFINGIYIGEDTIEGSCKIVIKDNDLYVQRLENGVWKDYDVIGKYITDDITLNTDYSIIKHSTSTGQYNIAKPTSTLNSLQLGDERYNNIYIAGQEIDQLKFYDNTTTDLTLQSDISSSGSSSEFYYDFTIPEKNGCKFPVVQSFALSNATAGIISLTVVDTSVINTDGSYRTIYKPISDFDLKKGKGISLTSTSFVWKDLSQLIYLTTGKTYRLIIKTQNPMTFNGKLVSSNILPSIKIRYKMAIGYKVLTKEDMTDSIATDNSNLVASAKAVNTVRKMISAGISGVIPMGFISCDDFNAITSGKNGELYFLSDDGILCNEITIKKGSWVMITETFGQDVGTERPITANDFTYSIADSTTKTPIFITDITPVTVGKNVSITYNDAPDNLSIKSIITDETTALNVTVEWDRTNTAYQGKPQINAVDVLTASKNGDTYIGTVQITDFSNGITASLGEGSYSVPVTIETPPVVSNIILSNMPVGQTSVKESDPINVQITADKDFAEVEIDDYELCKYKNESVTQGTSATVIGLVANRNITTPTNKTVKVRVKSPTGSWSEWFESITTMSLDNSVPSITITSINYLNGFQALKNSEKALINFTTTKTDSINITSPTNELSFAQTTASMTEATRIGGQYNDNTPNINFELKQNSNGAIVNVTTLVNIANVAPSLTNSVIVPKIRTGEDIPVTCTFDQKVSVTACTISTPNLGNLTTGTLPTTYNKNYSPSISAVDTDTHSPNNLTMQVTVKGMSGLVSVFNKYYIISGFKQKTITIAYPAITVTIPTITNQANLIISGTIDTDIPYPICTNYASPATSITDYNIVGTTLNLPPLSILGGFYYTTGETITILIEET